MNGGKSAFYAIVILVIACTLMILAVLFIIHADVHEILERMRAVGFGGY